ncbi:winged helix DNA-binding domain-containing protein [Paenibacillus gorillae]|uniref:winged helix DNA-binding domain-containing protein n=1 Tax=Paenibacillus gorillae TaxID=1243662 RepID=UPI0004B845E6|nr:winged helix DNA-binding domain-containing protein [Paenibacillus gorillae]
MPMNPPQRPASEEPRLLSRQALNRALLDRQLLMRRSDMGVLSAIEHLAGLQSQSPLPPYFALWTRLRDFRQEQLAELLLSRQAVRISLMRSTIHLVSAEDCLWMRPVLQPMLDQAFRSAYRKRLEGVDIDRIAEASRAHVEQAPLSFQELGELLSPLAPGREPGALAQISRAVLPLVQVPPRGIWGKSGQARHTTAEAWLGRPLAPAVEPEKIIVRYLAAFGPASVKDMQAWCGLTGLRTHVQRLRGQLVIYRDDNGVELFDLADISLPDPDAPVPPRFLSEFDNMLLSYADRSRILPDEYKPLVFTVNGIIKATILVDGFVSGLWRLETLKEKDSVIAILHIELFRELTAMEKEALADEGERLLAFAEPEASQREIRFGGDY